MRDIILIGAGGHCISCIDVIEETGIYRIKGILDLPHKIGNKLLSYGVIGSDDDLGKYIDDNIDFCISIGQIDSDNVARKRIFNHIESCGASMPSIISKNSYMSKHSSIGTGSVVFTGSIINAAVSIGDNCIVNSGSLIEHGTIIGDHCHISTSAIINGDCTIGNNCFIASGVIVRNGVSICDNTVVGMGSIVTKSIHEPGTYFGSPLKKV